MLCPDVGCTVAPCTAAAAGTAATTSDAATIRYLRQKCTGQRPVHNSRFTFTLSPIGIPSKTRFDGPDLAALTAAHWGRSRHRSRSRSSVSRRSRIILPVVDISVHPAIIVPVCPDRAGKAADRSADHRALQDAHARDDRTGRCAERRAAESARRRAGEDAVRARIVARGRAGIILTVIGITVDIA